MLKKSTFPWISQQPIQILFWNLKYCYTITKTIHIPIHINLTFILTKLFPLFRLRKCLKIHLSFNISATNTDIVLKLKKVLYHHLTNSYTNLHNSDFYFNKIISLFRLRKCSKIHLSFNISATNTDIVLKLKTVLNYH